jgi:hypothetical protein
MSEHSLSAWRKRSGRPAPAPGSFGAVTDTTRRLPKAPRGPHGAVDRGHRARAGDAHREPRHAEWLATDRLHLPVAAVRRRRRQLHRHRRRYQTTLRRRRGRRRTCAPGRGHGHELRRQHVARVGADPAGRRGRSESDSGIRPKKQRPRRRPRPQVAAESGPPTAADLSGLLGSLVAGRACRTLSGGSRARSLVVGDVGRVLVRVSVASAIVPDADRPAGVGEPRPAGRNRITRAQRRKWGRCRDFGCRHRPFEPRTLRVPRRRRSSVRQKVSICRAFDAADGTRTHDLLHGKKT